MSCVSRVTPTPTVRGQGYLVDGQEIPSEISASTLVSDEH